MTGEKIVFARLTAELQNWTRFSKSFRSSRKDPNVLSADAMIYCSDHQLERNTLLAERYRLIKRAVLMNRLPVLSI
jgi:hypothetical protein